MSSHKKPSTRRRGEDLREWVLEQWDRRPAWLERAALSRLLMRRVRVPLPSRGQLVGAVMATALVGAVAVGLARLPISALAPQAVEPDSKSAPRERRSVPAGVTPMTRPGAPVVRVQNVAEPVSRGGSDAQEPAPRVSQERSPAPSAPAPVVTPSAAPTAVVPSVAVPPVIQPPKADDVPPLRGVAEEVCRVLPNGKEKCKPAKKHGRWAAPTPSSTG